MSTLAKLINKVAQPLNGARRDYDPLLDLIGDARFVLLGVQSPLERTAEWEKGEVPEAFPMGV